MDANNGLLVVVVVIAVILLLLWGCGVWGDNDSYKAMHKEKSMKKELKHMAHSLKKMAYEKGDAAADMLGSTLKKAAQKVKGKVGRAAEVNLAHKMSSVAGALKDKMDDPGTTEELEAMAGCLEDMSEDLMNKGDPVGGTKEGYRYYYRGYYRPYWRYWRYYRPYRFYRPYYYYGGYW